MANAKAVARSEVKKELDRILSSKSFVRSPILSRFLRFIVEKTLDGEENQIKEYSVGTAVLFKPIGFNPQTDPSVRIHAIRLRKLLNEYYDNVHWDGSVRIFIQKGSYTPVFTAGGKAASLNGDHELETKTVFSEDWPDESICVVPFNGFILNKSLDFSVEGFCGFLSQKLSLFQDIKIKSFYSVAKYIDEGGTVEQLGRDMNVTYYLTGSLTVDDNRISVSVQLIHAKSNYFIWSHDFVEDVRGNTLSDVVNKIVDQIVVSLAGYSGIVHRNMFSKGENISSLSNSQANAVFWFYHYLTRQNETVFNEAVKHLEDAVKQDQSSSLCWSVLAMLYVDSVFFNYDSGTEDPLNRAIEYVNRALEINPDCQHGNITQGWINIFLKNKAVAIQALDKSYQVNPNASFFTAAAALGMALLGEYDRSKEFLEIAIPMNPLPYWWLKLPSIFIELKNKEFEKMLFHARMVGTPAGIQEHIFEIIALFYLGSMDALKPVLRTYISKHPDGLDHALKAWPMILFDESLIDQIAHALTEIKLIKDELLSVL
jgi:TolB-like protein